jgi:hypothetical protein
MYVSTIYGVVYSSAVPNTWYPFDHIARVRSELTSNTMATVYALQTRPSCLPSNIPRHTHPIWYRVRHAGTPWLVAGRVWTEG